MDNTSVFQLHTYLIGILVGLGTWFLMQGIEVKLSLILTAIATIATINILHCYVRDEIIVKRRYK